MLTNKHICYETRHPKQANAVAVNSQNVSKNLPRSPLTAAERTARLLRGTASSRFCTPFARDAAGINTEPRQDKDKTHALQRAQI